MSIIEGIEDVPKHIKAWIAGEEDLHPKIKDIIALIPNTITTLTQQAEAVGLPVLKAGAAQIETVIAGGLAGTTDKTAAGKNAIAALKSTGTTLTDDVLHIFATDLLNDAAKLVV